MSDDHFFIDEATNRVVVSAWSPRLREAAERAGVTSMWIKRWPEPSIDRLVPLSSQITKLRIAVPLKSLASIAEFTNVRKLTLTVEEGQALSTLDFSALCELRDLGIQGAARSLGNVNQSRSIERLSLSGCRLKDLTQLTGLGSLRELNVREVPLASLAGIETLSTLVDLGIQQVALRSLSGLDTLPHLRLLGVGMARHLTSIAEIGRLRKLTHLAIYSCKRVTDVECIKALKHIERLDLTAMGPFASLDFLRGFTRLKVLHLENVGNVPSIAILRSLQSLEEVLLAERTVVEDGDMSVLLELPKLRRILYTERRHYTPARDEIRAELTRRHPHAAASTP